AARLQRWSGAVSAGGGSTAGAALGGGGFSRSRSSSAGTSGSCGGRQATADTANAAPSNRDPSRLFVNMRRRCLREGRASGEASGSRREDLLHQRGQLFDRAGLQTGILMGPGEGPRNDLIAAERHQQLVRAHRPLPGEAELGVLAAGVLALKVVLVAEELGQLFAQIGVHHLRLAEHAETLEILGAGHLGRRGRRNALLRDEPRGQQTRGDELRQSLSPLLEPLLNLRWQARDAGSGRSPRRGWGRLVVLQAERVDRLRVLQRVERGRGVAGTGDGGNREEEQGTFTEHARLGKHFLRSRPAVRLAGRPGAEEVKQIR